MQYNTKMKEGECNMRTKLIKVGEVNPQELARISQIIKGYMTASEMATRLKVNPSTTSRILNAKVTGSVAEDTLIRLGEMITPEMGITKEDLYAANGYKEVEDTSVPYYDWREMSHILGSIIVRAVSNKGKSAWRFMEEGRFRYKDMLSLRMDLVIECDAVEDYNRPENHLWGFNYMIMRYSSMQINAIKHGIERERDYRMMLPRIGMRFIERISMYALMYSQITKEDYEFEEELMELPAKISFVYTSQEEYDYLIEKYKDLKVPMEASIVLLDLEEGKVIAEFPLKRTNGYRGQVFFDGQYFDDDDNPISEEEYDEMLDELVEEYISSEKKKDNKDE